MSEESGEDVPTEATGETAPVNYHCNNCGHDVTVTAEMRYEADPATWTVIPEERLTGKSRLARSAARPRSAKADGVRRSTNPSARAGSGRSSASRYGANGLRRVGSPRMERARS